MLHHSTHVMTQPKLGLFHQSTTNAPAFDEYVKDIHSTVELIKKNIKRAQENQKKYADAKRKEYSSQSVIEYLCQPIKLSQPQV